MAEPTAPTLSVKLSLSSTTYSFSSTAPPRLALTIESHASRPITLFTWRTPFDPASGMKKGCFAITDIDNDVSVPQTLIHINRAPLSRVRGSADEKYFLTLYPGVPVVISTEFSRGGDIRPQPKSVVERGWVLDEDGNEVKIRRSTQGCGVDGLEGGHRYRVDVQRETLVGCWWRWGEREEMLVEKGSTDCNLSSLQPEQEALEVGDIEGVDFGVE